MIEGLSYIPDFVTDEEADKLIKFIDEQEWNNELTRRTQQYGYKYGYKTYKAEKTKPIPDIFDSLLKELPYKFDQCIINEYKNFDNKCDGIAAHTDHTKLFDKTIVSISLLEPTMMTFTKGNESHDILLEKNSLLILKGAARYEWRHEISKNKTFIHNNVKYTKSRRVSVTFRKMIL